MIGKTRKGRRGGFCASVLLVTALPGWAAAPAELVAAQGRADVRPPGAADWLPAKARQELPAQTVVRTGDASWASLVFADQSQIKLAANSVFHVREVAAETTGKTVLELRKGKAWGQAKTPPGTLSVRTPTANAGIQGTDWVIEVADDGATTLAVLSGAIDLSNEHGSVRVGRHEEAVARPGAAPVKRPLVNPRARTQWLVSSTIEWARYPEAAEARFSPVVEAARAGHDAEALARILDVPETGRAPFLDLLAADLLRRAARFAEARALLERAQVRHPDDPRLTASAVSLALADDAGEAATALLRDGLARWPQSVELALADGEHAVWTGDGIRAAAAYDRARALAPGEARAARGAGMVAGEREDAAAARAALGQALALDPGAREAAAELAWVDTLADRLPEARARLVALLEANVQDYVARTALGYLELKAGNREAAVAHLRDANTIEPRYARAARLLGIAYYQQGSVKAAVDLLTRAAELDPHDPLPLFLLAQIRSDQWEPGAAVLAAREGVRRLPWQKSLNQVASDLKGSANLGAAYARFGLEEWAARVAHDSHDPLWAGSHFFQADRQSGEFNRNSALLLGFLTDPTAFGVAGRTQPLVAAPGMHGSARYWAERGGGTRVDVPALTVQGYANAVVPVAWLVEGQGQRWRPGGDALATAGQLSVGLGARPDERWRLFYFGNDFTPDFEQPLAGGRRVVSGHASRHDAGVAFRHGPQAQTWLKFGVGEESSQVRSPDRINPATRVDSGIARERRDVALRHQWQPWPESAEAGRWLFAAGVESARAEDHLDTAFTRAAASTPSTTGTERSADRSRLAWGSWIWRAASEAGRAGESPWTVQADLAWTDVEVHTERRARVGGQSLVRLDGRAARERLQLRLGAAWRPAAAWTLRGTVQDWTRPVSFAGLAPIDTAGIALDDSLTLPGGRLRRERFQIEHAGAQGFSQAWIDHKRVENVYFGADGADNPLTELADLSRLQQDERMSLARDVLEGNPVFTAGRVRELGVAHNAILSPAFSLYARYRHADGENTGRFAGRGDPLPYVARHQGSIGGQWVVAPRWTVQARLTWRSERWADELLAQRLRPGWDGALLSSWQSPRKDWQVDLYVRALFHPDLPTTAGVRVAFRY